jgi:hypothetical protein
LWWCFRWWDVGIIHQTRKVKKKKKGTEEARPRWLGLSPLLVTSVDAAGREKTEVRGGDARERLIPEPLITQIEGRKTGQWIADS